MKDFTTFQTFPIPEAQFILQEKVAEGLKLKKVLIAIIGVLTVATVVVIAYAVHQKAKIKVQNESEQ